MSVNGKFSRIMRGDLLQEAERFSGAAPPNYWHMSGLPLGVGQILPEKRIKPTDSGQDSGGLCSCLMFSRIRWCQFGGSVTLNLGRFSRCCI
jgi:hypothetical protein